LVIFRKSISGATELALARFVARARRAAGMRGQVTVLVTSSRELHDLNRRFRGKDKATDVLSFPAAPIEGDDNEGDIAISADIATENATRFGHAPLIELKILALHGILHLAGYDHETDNGKMARKESRLRRELNLPDALIARTEGGTSEGRGFSRAVRPSGQKGASAPAGGRTTNRQESTRIAKRATRNAQRQAGNAKRKTGNGKRSAGARSRA
jgi:probable rRNA maturation factor